MLKKILVFFIILISMVNISFEQSETILKSSVKEIKKKKRKKRRAENRKTINYEANTLLNALRPVLGANIFYKDGKAIINTGTLFATGNNFYFLSLIQMKNNYICLPKCKILLSSVG